MSNSFSLVIDEIDEADDLVLQGSALRVGQIYRRDLGIIKRDLVNVQQDIADVRATFKDLSAKAKPAISKSFFITMGTLLFIAVASVVIFAPQLRQAVLVAVH